MITQIFIRDFWRIPEISSSDPDLENKTSFPTSHCEHLKGAWQSHRNGARLLHFVRNDNFLYRDLGREKSLTSKTWRIRILAKGGLD
jgi:hypothetical protein